MNNGGIFLSSVKHSDHQGGRCTRGKLELLANNDLPSQWHSKDDTEETYAHSPDYKLEERKVDASAFSLSLVGLQKVLKSWNDANEATSQRHCTYRSSNRLHQDILDGREGI